MPDDQDAAADEEVERLSREMDAAFRQRDMWWNRYRESGLDQDEAATDEWDRVADRLLTQYNAACAAQYAEVDRRRAENLARYAAEQVAWDMARDGGGGMDMPPAAQPYQPNTSAPRDTASQPSEQGATDMNVPGSTAVNTVRDRWDQFFTWLFDWGGYNASARPQSPHAVAARVGSKLAEQEAVKSIPVAPEAAKRGDRRPQPEPQDLDALTAPPPPRTNAKFRPPPPKPRLNTWSNVQQDWCSCEGNAHDARCRFASVRRLDVSGHFSPPPSSGASTEPAPTNQP